MANNVFDKLNKVSAWKKAATFVVLALVIVGTFYQMSWKNLDNTALRLGADLQDLDRRYREQKAVADDLATFQENTKKLEEDLRIALTQLPREKEIPNLLRDIYTLGRKSGVEFKSFQPQAEIARKLYAEVPIKLQITGTYHDIAVFYDRIGKLSRIINISDVDVVAGSSKDKLVPLAISCTATTFMFLGSGGG